MDVDQERAAGESADQSADHSTDHSTDHTTGGDVRAAERAPDSRPSPRRRLHVGLYLLALVLACLCVAGGVLSYLAHGDRAEQARVQENYGDVLAAASAEAEAFVNIDYQDPEATFDAVSQGATGEFRDQYQSVSKDLIELLRTSKSVMTGTVTRAAVSDLDQDSARVLVVTDGSVTNTAVTADDDASSRSFRLALEMVKVDGEWLTNNLEFVG